MKKLSSFVSAQEFNELCYMQENIGNEQAITEKYHYKGHSGLTAILSKLWDKLKSLLDTDVDTQELKRNGFKNTKESSGNVDNGLLKSLENMGKNEKGERTFPEFYKERGNKWIGNKETMMFSSADKDKGAVIAMAAFAPIGSSKLVEWRKHVNDEGNTLPHVYILEFLNGMEIKDAKRVWNKKVRSELINALGSKCFTMSCSNDRYDFFRNLDGTFQKYNPKEFILIYNKGALKGELKKLKDKAAQEQQKEEKKSENNEKK